MVRLVNDFVAAGYGLLTLDVESECITLQVKNTRSRLYASAALPALTESAAAKTFSQVWQCRGHDLFTRGLVCCGNTVSSAFCPKSVVTGTFWPFGGVPYVFNSL